MPIPRSCLRLMAKLECAAKFSRESHNAAVDNASCSLKVNSRLILIAMLSGINVKVSELGPWTYIKSGYVNSTVKRAGAQVCSGNAFSPPIIIGIVLPLGLLWHINSVSRNCRFYFHLQTR